MSQAELMDVTKICASFPPPPSPQIIRDNIISTIDMIYEDGTELVVIEGMEGMGKSTLLAQYAQTRPNNCISLFIKTTSRWGYDPDILKYDLFNQLNWLLQGEELNHEHIFSDSIWRTNIIKLRKKIKQKREQYYFIIDGLFDIPSDDNRALEAIL